ncbi:hypothetical protein BDV93DRAFT_515685 [Ceratobasidium sp. AG-I]|nr:hypothetical protein BDV93DRAFT_515685 [Ceratobasidium sp. AG-I]
MGPLRAESSTVSLPPSERMLAKRRAKAIRNGLPIPRDGTNNAKQKGKAPAPILAATRERRSAALNVAYINQPDGYHIKRVVRRPATPKRAPPVPYLPSQEDIDRSEDDSDNDSDSDGSSTTATVLDGLLTTGSDADMFMDDGNAEMFATQPGEMDYDAEGETDDEVMNSVALPPPLANCAPNMAWGAPPNLAPQMWPCGSEKANDLIGDASEEDLRDLFAGLGSLPADFPDYTPASFPSTQDLAADIQESGPFAMRHQAPIPKAPSGSVHNPFAHLSPPARQATQPAPWIGTPFDTLRLSPHPAPVNPAPCSNTRDRVAQARAQAQSSSLVIPRPTPIPAAELLAGPLLRRPPLRRSLNLPSFLGGEDDDDSLDEDQARPSTPVVFDETDVGLNRSTPTPVTQAQSRAARYYTIRVLPHHASRGSLRIPTVAELQLNASRVYRINRRRARNRTTTTTQSARSRKTLSTGELSKDQWAVISQMEYHVMKVVVCINPWPQLEQRQEFLWGAQRSPPLATIDSGWFRNKSGNYSNRSHSSGNMTDSQNACLHQKRMKKSSRSIDLDIPDAVDNLGALEDDGGPNGQMHDAEDQELPAEDCLDEQDEIVNAHTTFRAQTLHPSNTWQEGITWGVRLAGEWIPSDHGDDLSWTGCQKEDQEYEAEDQDQVE